MMANLNIIAGTKMYAEGPSEAAPPGITYFGQCDSSGNTINADTDNTGGVATMWNRDEVTHFTCPGSGTQNVVDLKVCCHIGTGSPNIRLAIYTVLLVFVAEGSAEIPVAGASDDTWQGHTWSSSYPTLTGSTNYLLVVTADGDVVSNHAYNAGAGNYVSKYDTTDRTGGFEVLGDLPPGTSGTIMWPIRCGVQPA